MSVARSTLKFSQSLLNGWAQWFFSKLCNRLHNWKWSETSPFPPISNVLASPVWASDEYSTLRERLKKAVPCPSIVEGNADGYVTIDASTGGVAEEQASDKDRYISPFGKEDYFRILFVSPSFFSFCASGRGSCTSCAASPARPSPRTLRRSSRSSRLSNWTTSVAELFMLLSGICFAKKRHVFMKVFDLVDA